VSKRVGIYTRISDDQAGESLGVTRQEQDCRKVCRAHGWTVFDVYEHNSVSASNRQVVREHFERLLSDLANGAVDGVVVYDLDRFARQPRDLERAIDLYQEHCGLASATSFLALNRRTHRPAAQASWTSDCAQGSPVATW